MFTATQWDTADDKAKMLDKLQRFVDGGFRRTMFTKALYRRLSNMFSHIAHYDADGFYDEWFSSDEARIRWVEYVTGYRTVGDPAWTWSDVEAEFQVWLRGRVHDPAFARRVLATCA